jgi:hypothetical protein
MGDETSLLETKENVGILKRLLKNNSGYETGE